LAGVKKRVQNYFRTECCCGKKVTRVTSIQLKKKSTLLSFWSAIPQNALKAGEREAVEIISVDKPATSPALAPTSTNAD
jgi:hypothetical protein